MADYVLSVKVTGDAKEFEKTMKEAGATFHSFEQTYQKSGLEKLSGQFKSVGSGLTAVGNKLSGIQRVARVTGAALAGVILKKGWARMTEIDEAKAKLKAILGEGKNFGKQMEAIDNSVKASVKGTAFALNEGYSTAAGAMAAGIKAGDQLTNYLGSVAGAAALSGRSMEEMGGIFNKVATSGKATNEVLNQLRDSGLDVDSALAKAMGVTRSEVAKLASEGKIDFETFRKAMEDAYNGKAVEIGMSTLTGTIDNIGAALGRVGEAFWGTTDDGKSFAGQLLPLMQDLIEYIDNQICPKVEKIGSVAGEVLPAVVSYFKDGNTNLDGMSKSAQKVMNTLKPFMAIIKGIVTTFMEMPSGLQAATVGFLLFGGTAFKALGGIMSMAGSVTGFFGKFAGKSKAITEVGTASQATSSKVSGMGANMMKAGAGVMFLGVGLLLAGIGMTKFASAAVVLANAGGAATAIFFGMIGAFAGLMLLLSALGPGALIAGVSVALLGAGLLMAGAGAYLLATAIKIAVAQLPKVAKSGDAAAQGITAIGNAAKNLKLGSILKLAGLALDFKVLGNGATKAGNGLRAVKNSASAATSGLSKFGKTASSNMKTAKNAIDGVKKSFDKVKNLKGKITIKAKVPHFSVSWSTQKKGKTSVHIPTVKQWATGAVFNGPSLLNGGNLVGEAGPEAVAPISTLQNYVTDAVVDAGATGGFDYDRFAKAVAEALNEIDFTTEIDLDGKKLADGIAKPVYSAISKLQERDNRKLGYV